MKKRTIAGTLGAAIVTALALQAKEPAVMTVNGHDVPLSEFEYLYLKNQAQTQLQPIDEYAEIFKLYKLKVADALNMGLDTTKAFRDEYQQYRTELALPYLTDSAYIKSLVDEAYSYYTNQVRPRHILLMKSPDALMNRAIVNRLDSIRGVITSGNATFADMAKQFSQDRGSAREGGDIGWTSNPNFPYAFLKTIYTLKPGELSEVVETPTAYHLITVDGIRPNPGYLTVSHIMKVVPENATPEQEAALKAQIDSIYSVVEADPNKFEEMAVRFTDDNNSRRSGGRMQPFPMGAIVEPFDSIAWSLTDGAISKPLRTPVGWHIIKRWRVKPLETADEMRQQLTAIVTNPRDIRAQMIDSRQTAAFGKDLGLKPVKKNLDIINAYIKSNGIDSMFVQNMNKAIGNKPLYTFKGGSLTLKDMAPQLQKLVNLDPQFAAEEFGRRTDVALRHKLLPLKEKALEQSNPDYRNLLNEFRDGSLLYEAGRIRVWDKAATDTIGLENYFNQHRQEYTWQQPRAKGFLIQATSDSVQNLVKDKMKQLKPEQYIPVLRETFGQEISIDPILAAKGTNAMIDYLAFDGPEAKSPNSRFNTYFIADLRLLNAPEELADVRGLVIADYQNYLMQQWEDQLKEKYPVTVNTKALKKVRTK